MLTQQKNRPICISCKLSLAKLNGISKHGFKKYHKYCSTCSKAIYSKSQIKQSTCENCGFVAKDSCQLDIIKVDSIIKTYCANCSRYHNKHHRKKTLLDITVDSDVIL